MRLVESSALSPKYGCTLGASKTKNETLKNRLAIRKRLKSYVNMWGLFTVNVRDMDCYRARLIRCRTASQYFGHRPIALTVKQDARYHRVLRYCRAQRDCWD